MRTGLRILLFVLAAVRPLAFTSAVFADPHLEANDDILEQRERYAPVDDLVLFNPALVSNNTQVQMQATPFFTDNNSISRVGGEYIIGGATTLGSDPYPLPQQTRAARLFNTVNDYMITVGKRAQEGGKLGVYNGFGTLFTINTADVDKLQLAVGDVTGDGFDDLVVMNDSAIYVLTANDVENPAAGLQQIASTSLCASSPCTDQQPASQPVIADFANDGVPTLAWAGGNQGGGTLPAGNQWIYFARICIQNTNGANGSAFCASAGKNSINISDKKINLGFSGHGKYCAGTSALAAGNFFSEGAQPGTRVGKKLFYAWTWTSSSAVECSIDLNSFSFGPDLTPIQRDHLSKVWRPNGTAQIFAASDRLYWWGNNEQAVVAFSGLKYQQDHTEGDRHVSTITFDDNGRISIHDSDSVGNADWQSQFYGLAIGRFNNDSTNTSSFSPYIAVLEAAEPGGSFDPRIVFLHPEDPANGQWKPIGQQEYIINDPYYDYSNFAYVAGSNMLQSGDLQGRGIRIGPPVIARIHSSLQPKAIAGLPPMMVDLVADPTDLGKAPKVVNFTAIPTSFWNKFNATSSSSNQSSTQSTTSSASANSEATEITAGVGFVPPSSVGGSGNVAYASVKAGREQTQSETVSENFDTYTSSAFNVALQTNLQDVVWYTYDDYNLYYYPIIGVSLCPEAKPDCTPAERQPSYIEVAGPSNSTNSYDAGFSSWYQPIYEPFQLFSYPRTPEQLAVSIGEVLAPLTDVPQFFTSNNIIGTYSNSWVSDTTQARSVGTSSELKYSGGVTFYSGQQDWKKVQGPAASISISGSYSRSTANKSVELQTTKLGESSGLTGQLPGTFLGPGSTYQYSFSPVVYGEPPASGEDPDAVSGVDIPTHGILFGSFLADAAGGNSGSFWKSGVQSQYNQAGKVDIALNHPFRWHFEPRNYTGGGAPPECLAVATGGITYQCAYEYPPDPADVWGSAYYLMRGLLVTEDAPQGPQAAQATEGRTVYLQARVYNYSFQAMQPGWTLHVRFYRQPWDISANVPADDAVLLNPGAQEIIVDDNGALVLVPPYGVTNPNFVTAKTSFDTTGLGGQHFVFWVVAWAADQNGKLVQEVYNHGLQSYPGTLKNIGDAPLQTVNVTYPSAPEYSGTTSFTNNVAFFRQDFYVAPATTGELVTAANRQPTTKPRLSIGKVRATPANLLEQTATSARNVRAAQNSTFHITADIRVSRASTSGIMVKAEDTTTGKVIRFDSEMIPDLQPERSHRVEFLYHADKCGRKRIRIEVEPGRSMHCQRSTFVSVKCRPSGGSTK